MIMVLSCCDLLAVLIDNLWIAVVATLMTEKLDVNFRWFHLVAKFAVRCHPLRCPCMWTTDESSNTSVSFDDATLAAMWAKTIMWMNSTLNCLKFYCKNNVLRSEVLIRFLHCKLTCKYTQQKMSENEQLVPS